MKMTGRVLVFACAAALACPDAFAQSQRKNGQEPVINATESPKASETAAQRRKGRSALPPGDFELRPEQFGLVRPKRVAYDDALAEVCRSYARNDARKRAAMRRALSEDDLGYLNGFAARAAVFALREHSAERVAEGLAAIAMIELDRVDSRDVTVTLGLLHHAAERVGAEPPKLFREAAALAEPKTARLIRSYPTRPASIKDVRQASGYDEVETEAGVGFISWEFDKYDPTYDLKQLAVEVAELVAADKYRAMPSVASELPRVWLQTRDNTQLDRALRKVRAGASVSGDLLPDAHPDATSQMLIFFVVELEDESAVRDLLAVAERKRSEPVPQNSPEPGVHMFAAAEGRLFCLVAARSYVYGVEGFETDESLRRFSPGLAAILRRHAKR